MAERVQADLELMLTELEQMQRVNLLSPEEVKVLIKRRKRFEYKLQKQTKIKEDILAYIQYEGCLLDLIELRRDKIGYLHKKNEIDGAISKRIHKLFKIVEHRFGQTDPKVWITHLNFLERMDWKVESGKILRRFLQILSHNEEVWVFAARLQFKQGIEFARTLLLEGLRFHPKSVIIYREYFMLELQYLQMIHDNPDLLNDVQSKDEVQNGKIVQMVFMKAVEDCQQDLFTAELLGLSQRFPRLFQNLRKSLLDDYGSKFSTWTILITIELYPKFKDQRSAIEKLKGCYEVMDESMEHLSTSDKCKMLHYNLSLLEKIGDQNTELTGICSDLVLKLLNRGKKLEILNSDISNFLDDIENKP